MLSANTPYWSICEAQKAIAAGNITAQALSQQYIEAIKRLDPELNAITAVNDRALEEASKLGAIDADRRGPLFGIPIVIKDQIETAGITTTFGSEVCKDYVPSRDATLVQKLKDAGAVILGKSTMPDWATSWFSTSSLSGTTKNPYDLSREPGGSSSGSGAAVAAGLALAAIGGDTGGSIRLPASFCGLVGVRVTPGRISRNGMSALVHIQDTPGPMTHSVEDAAKILDVIVGYDEQDEFTSVSALLPLSKSRTPFHDAAQDISLKDKRLGVLRQAFGSDKSVNAILDRSLQDLRASGAEIIDVSIPDLSTYLSKSSTFILRSKSDVDAFLASRPALAHLTLQDIHSSGRYHNALLDLISAAVKGPDNYRNNIHFTEALLLQAEFQRVVASIFAKHGLDAMVYPTCQVLPPKTEDVLRGKWSAFEFPTNTIIASQLLFPAVSVPAGMTKDLEQDPEGPVLPVGLEILGLSLREESLMAVAAGVEEAFRAAKAKGSTG